MCKWADLPRRQEMDFGLRTIAVRRLIEEKAQLAGERFCFVCQRSDDEQWARDRCCRLSQHQRVRRSLEPHDRKSAFIARFDSCLKLGGRLFQTSLHFDQATKYTNAETAIARLCLARPPLISPRPPLCASYRLGRSFLFYDLSR